MPRRVRKKPSLFAPAGSLLKKLSESDKRLRRKVLRVGLWVFVALFGYSLMFGTYGLPRITKLELQESSLIVSNRNLAAELIDAVRVRDMLIDNPYYIEHVARTRYHMVRPNEIVYRYRTR